MRDRLFIGVLGNKNSGKSTTWNELFGTTVKTGNKARWLKVAPELSVEVFLVSGSFEERKLYAKDVLDKQDCRIVLCSLQYIEDVKKTLEYVKNTGFHSHIQWLNPGYNDSNMYFDSLGLESHLLSIGSSLTIRSGKVTTRRRVREIRECIHGWAYSRNLISTQ